MGIKCTNSKSEIDKLFVEIARIIREEILRTLKYLGEQCNTRIRDRSAEESWIDRTGNLRSSIGYAVFEYGKQYTFHLGLDTGKLYQQIVFSASVSDWETKIYEDNSEF